MPPRPVAVIHRRPRGTEGGPAPASRRRGPLGDDALTNRGASRNIRSAIEQVVDDLAEQRNRPKP
jgi:hypothetical protein